MRLALFTAAALALVACAQPSDEEEEGAAGPASSEDEIVWEPISMALGNSPNFAQLGNGNTMTVVSRDFGRGAKAGALVELFYPKYATDNLWDSYIGVRANGKRLAWAHDLKLTGQRVLDDTGIVQSDFAGDGFTLRIEDVIRQGSDAHVRRVTITNAGGAALKDVALDFYAFYTLGNFPQGDKIAYDAGRGAFVQTDDDAKISVATVADQMPSKVHCGYALRPLFGQRDARVAAEANRLDGCTGTNEAAVTGVNGVLEHALADVAPHSQKSVTYAIGISNDGAKALTQASAALQGGFDARANEDRAHWASVLGRAKSPARMTGDVRAVYRRAIITMLQHRVSNGAFIAAPTLTSPVYRFVWPRDGSKTAVDLLEAGFATEAAAFFEFLETQLLDDGSFAVNYFPDGSRPLFNWQREKKNENDQPGMLAWGVDRVYATTKDRAWLEARYPAVRRVAEYLVSVTGGANGLVEASRDLWELETGSSWTYANGSAVAGLRAAARSATTLGKTADAQRYEARAKAIEDAMNAKLVAPGGYFARGIKGDDIDERLEIANLALGVGGFGLYRDTDPKLAIVGDLVKQRLLTQGGGVRRYEGDRYYGGQPWPVANTWLSLHELARGDRDGAQARFDAITKMALATESKMLGEQFDEKNKKWLSAMPLVWSEAAYVRNALALYE